jgi:hypothetical protein
MTEPGLFDLLRGSGIEISEGQVHNILMNESEKYAQESEKILSAGLEEAPSLFGPRLVQENRNIQCILFQHSRAISNASWVWITRTLTFEPGEEIA